MFVFGHRNKKDKIKVKVRAVDIAPSKLCKERRGFLIRIGRRH